MEQSHRDADYDAVHRSAVARLRRLLRVPDSHDVLLLQGGASGMFAWVPLNFLVAGRSADYVVAGRWGEKALQEAARIGTARQAGSGKVDGEYRRVPEPDELELDPGAAYLHVTSNNTVVGTQMKTLPMTDVPLVVDASSDILTRELDVARTELVYASAQKNLGPAGVTVVVARRDWMASAREDIPKFLRFQTHADAESLYHTPPTFAVYLLELVLAWTEEQGGLDAMIERTAIKQQLVYDAVDAHPRMFTGTTERDSRSRVNPTFRLPSSDLQEEFLELAEGDGLLGLRGHRSVGGIRASLYNAVDVEHVERLAHFMRTFAAARSA